MFLLLNPEQIATMDNNPVLVLWAGVIAMIACAAVLLAVLKRYIIDRKQDSGDVVLRKYFSKKNEKPGKASHSNKN